jgi:NADH-quinone oxidoreductase subunit L
VGHTDVARHDADSATVGVRAAVGVLAVLTVVGGVIVLTPLLDVGGHVSWWAVLMSLLLVVGAAFGVRALARGEDPAVRLVAESMPRFDSGFGIDRLYVATVATPVLALARLVVFLDREVVDAYVRGAAVTTTVTGRGGHRAHATERAASGLAWVVAGVVVVGLAGVAWW